MDLCDLRLLHTAVLALNQADPVPAKKVKKSKAEDCTVLLEHAKKRALSLSPQSLEMPSV